MMKKLSRCALVVLLVLLLCLSAIPVSAAGKGTVVFLSDAGTGDGSTPEKATNDIYAAYDFLDLTKDCTVVVCGVYTQATHFNWCEEYTGSVTFTSVYGGKDYRTEGASYQFKPSRFVCWGDTRFENMDFIALGTNLLVIGQHNPITLGEGVTMTGEKMTGTSISKAFCLMGGYQSGQDDPPLESDKDTNITVLSGSGLYIVPFSRQIGGKYTGTAHVYIGGTAEVTTLHGSAAYPDGVVLGKVEVTVEGNASIGNFYGCTNDVEMDSFTLNWLGGTFGGNDEVFEWDCHHTPGKVFTATNGTLLRYSSAVKNHANFAEIAAVFSRTEEVVNTPPVTTDPVVTTDPTPVETADPTPVVTDPPAVETDAPPATTNPGGEETPETGDPQWVVLSAALISLAVVVVISKKTRANSAK